MFHKLTYSPDIRADAMLFPEIEHETRSFAERFDLANQIDLDWSKVRDERNRDLIRLTIKDANGQVHSDIAHDDVRKPYRLRHRMNKTYDDLLSIRLKRLLRELGEMAGSGDAA